MRHFKPLSVVLFPAFLLATSAANAEKPVLTQVEAIKRYDQVGDLRYLVDLDLTPATVMVVKGEKKEKGKEKEENAEFRGTVTIDFTVKPGAKLISESLFLDFNGEIGSDVGKCQLNGKTVDFRWNESKTRISVPSSLLKEGEQNQIQIDFRSHFTSKGKGFHRHVDTDDNNEVYVYTNLEPFFANEVFPLFDQPDLKGTFEYNITVPGHWKTIGNTREDRVTTNPSNPAQSIWHFPPSPKMSSYLIGISAGPFTVFEPESQNRFRSTVPVRLIARKSLAKKVEVQTWFDLVYASLEFYESHFGAYPFGKSDHIIVPGTASSAMESLAAITYNEEYISSGKMTASERTDLATTVVHEMSHQWFGNLVTMKWWDDLWLNESFATFMASLVLDEYGGKLGLLDSWNQFFATKMVAYRADSYSTTHPISVLVVDTLEGFSNFDAITYRKGASVLKQLYFFLGKADFFSGLKNYFKEFAGRNATQSDFLGILGRASGKDLITWGRLWIGTSGTNSVRATFLDSADGGKKLRIEQLEDPMSHGLRPHKTQVGFYQLSSAGQVELKNKILVEYSGPLTEVALGSDFTAPDLLFPNVDDLDFANVILDSATIEFLTAHLGKIEDPLLKQQLYFSLWQMVRDAQLPASQYIDLILSHMVHETDPSLLGDLLGKLRSSLSYLSSEEKIDYNSRIVQWLFQRLETASGYPDVQEALFDGLTGFVVPNEWQDTLVSWLDRDSPSVQRYLSGFELHQDRRWKVISALSRSGYSQSENLISTEISQDTSGQKRKDASASSARTAFPDRVQKQQWLGSLTTPTLYDAKEVYMIGAELHSYMNLELTSFVTDSLLNSVLAMSKSELDRKTGYFINGVYPIGLSRDFDESVKAFVLENSFKFIVPDQASITRKTRR